MYLDVNSATLGATVAIGETFINSGHVMLKGDYGNDFDRTTKSNSFIILIGNDNALFRKVFNNIEYTSYVEDDELTKTISSVLAFNNHQVTPLTTLTPGTNVIKRGTTWRFTIPRDSSNNRITDYYIGLELSYDNSNNKKIVIEDIILHYLIPSL
jgi:hypothetical protein